MVSGDGDLFFLGHPSERGGCLFYLYDIQEHPSATWFISFTVHLEVFS